MANSKSKEEKREKTITATPVATKYGSEKIQVNYYTKTGKEVPAECVGKKVVDVSSFRKK